MSRVASSLALVSLVVALSGATALIAQTAGTIEGAVFDPAGAAVPGAAIKLTHTQTGVVRESTSNEAGQYSFDRVPIGTYDINVTAAGFKVSAVSSIKVDAAARVRRDVTLEVGNLQESVTVEATASQVQTSEGTVSSVITTEQINTAVLNGRNFARLAMILPGAVYQSGSDELANAGLGAPGSPVSINGLNNKTGGWFVDGAFNMNVGNGEANQHIPVLDTLAEVQVQTANYSARYGTAGGAVINAVTRSGTSQFHGTAYHYLRNDRMDARNFFSPTVVPLKQNNFGFTIGGPVVLPWYNRARNKTFFFWSEDWRYRRSATAILTATPTADLRAGNFQVEAARTGRPLLDPETRQPFPNNVIPANRIDPNAALLLRTYFPNPNNPAGGFNNFINLGSGKLDPRSDTVKIDHNFRDTIRGSFKLAHDDISVRNPNVPLFGASPFPGIFQVEETRGWVGTANVTMTLSPRTTNEAFYSFKKFGITLGLADNTASQVRPQGLSIRDFYRGANTLNLIPNISFTQGWGGIGTSQLPLNPATDDTHIVSDNFSHVAGRHTLQAGGMLLYYNKTQAVFNQTMGSYNFSGVFTNHPVGDYLLGLAATYSQSRERFIRRYSFRQTEWFAQDDWRVNRKLTLNLGMRLYVIPMTTVAGDQMTSFLPERYDPARAPQVTAASILVPTPGYDPLNGIVQAGTTGVPRGFANTYWGWAPRFGFAWDPRGDGKLAIRGGYGMSHLTSGNNQSSLVLNPPFNVAVSLVNVPLSDPSEGTPAAPRPLSLSAFNPTFQRPRVQTWSFTIQRELPGQFLVMGGYVGSRGTNFELWIDRNAPDFGTRIPGLDFDPRLNTNTVNLNVLRPFVGYADITQYNSGLSSIYHSFQSMAQRRFGKGFALQGVYTWSKAIGEAQTRRDMRAQNPLNWRAERGPTDFDRTHVFSMNYIWDLPLLRGQRSLLGHLFGNWQLAGFYTAQSGLALTPGISLGTRGLATRPTATGVSPEGQRTKEQWFNPAAFTAPAPGRYGNSGVGVIRGPGFHILDTSLSKIFPVRERMSFKIGGEFFNTLNHTNWNGVSTSLGAGNYGQIVSARDPRRIQLMGRFEF